MHPGIIEDGKGLQCPHRPSICGKRDHPERQRGKRDGVQQMAELTGHGLSAAEAVPQDGFFDHHGELVARRLDDAVTAHPRPHGVFDIIGRSVETRVGQQQRARVRRGLEKTRDNRRAVDLEQARALIQRPPGILGMAQARTRQPPPLHVHRVGRPGRRDEVGGLTLGAAYPAPGLDVGVGECLLGRLDAAGLRLVPAGRRGQRPGGQARVQPNLAQALRELLPCSLDA